MRFPVYQTTGLRMITFNKSLLFSYYVGWQNKNNMIQNNNGIDEKQSNIIY